MFEMYHNAACFIFRWAILMPVGLYAYLLLCIAFPAIALHALLTAQNTTEFKSELYTVYVEMPRDFFNWCILGR